MKLSVTLIIFLFSIISINSQVFSGTPVSGFPSGTTAQITSIGSPVEATIAYSTDEKIFYYYDGINWVALRSEPNVYVGFFIINAPGGTTATTFNQVITGLPFQPSQITFVAHANVESLSVNSAGSGGLNTATLQNAFGTANGFARNDGGGTITQATIYVGGSGSSINSISRYSSNSQCFGLRYGNQNAVNMGIISGSLSTFNTDGFTININYSLGTSGNTNRDNDILDESLVVLYTAYR
ncbi:hypothetical protein [uncultured Tenacibaculum sp.]|uniref:hypothetical protein n=1 Tax=uncultured Tenacibaculum sp. TaxID=174713 RepID=UPI00261B73A8|nr:hypothetical protein [uncultured Tenacibaculum sp.]